MQRIGVMGSLFAHERLANLPFVPFFSFTYLSKLWQTPSAMLFSDPSKLTSAIRQTHSLLSFDVLTIPYDPILQAEALGCRIEWPLGELAPVVTRTPRTRADLSPLNSFQLLGRLPVVVEATKRLVLEFRGRLPILAVLSGPVTTASTLVTKSSNSLAPSLDFDSYLLEYCSEACLMLVKSYLDLGVAGVIIVEKNLNNLQSYEDLMEPVWNVIDYYHADSIFLLQDDKLEAEEIVSLGSRGVVAHLFQDQVKESIERLLADDRKCLGFEIPSKSLGNHQAATKLVPEELLRIFEKYRKNIFATTDGVVPLTTPVSDLKKLTAELKEGIAR